MNFTSVRVRKGAAVAFGTIAASAALVLSGVTSASAADHQLGPDDIIGFENGDEESDGYNYDQWHIGSTYDTDAVVTDSLTFDECSVTFLPTADPEVASITQLLKGFPVDERLDTVEEVAAFLDSLAVTMESGSVTLQIPMFFYAAPEQDGIRSFTTLRNADAFTGAGTFTLDGQPLTDSSGLGDLDGTEELLEVLEDAPEGARFEVLGFGITGAEDSVVNSVSALGDTFYFGTGDCLPVDDVDEDDDAETPTAPTRPVAVDTGA